MCSTPLFLPLGELNTAHFKVNSPNQPEIAIPEEASLHIDVPKAFKWVHIRKAAGPGLRPQCGPSGRLCVPEEFRMTNIVRTTGDLTYIVSKCFERLALLTALMSGFVFFQGFFHWMT